MLEQMPVLQPCSTVVSIPRTNSCCTQPLIHLDTAESRGLGGEEGREVGQELCVPSRGSLSHTGLFGIPPDRDPRQALTTHTHVNDLCWKQHSCPGAFFAHKQMEQDGYELRHPGHQNKRLLLTLSYIGGLRR